MFNRTAKITLAGLLFACWPTFLFGGETNPRALQDISTVKVYFDVNVGEANKLITRLKLINDTHSQLVSSGVQPELVVGFRGKATRFVTRGDDYVFTEDTTAKQKVHGWVQQFKNSGISMEQCLIAAGFQEVDSKDFLPEINLVDNGYVSMIGYQTKGYAQVPMD
ncbi:MAG: hypothetical protein ABFS19_10065 [Thermodesulfobacteriota bacterium]